MKAQPSDRPMPHDLAAERAVLGALIVDQRCATSVFDVLNAVDFYLPANAQLFGLIRRMVQHAEPVDIVTVCSRVLEQDAEVYGGAGYVASLPEHCVSPSAAPHYAATVRHASQRRMLLAALHRATDLVNQGERETIEDLGGAVAEELLGIANAGRRRNTWSAAEAWDEVERQAEAIMSGVVAEKVTRVIPTGYAELDAVMRGGFRGGDLVVVGGAPGSGKSALAMSFCAQAMLAGLRVLYLSAEPRLVEWGERLVSIVTGVPHARVTPSNARLRSQADWDAIAKWRVDIDDAIRRSPFIFQPGMSLSQATMHAKSTALTGRVDLVVVDHLHLMNHDKQHGERLDQAIGRTTGGLKRLAGELDCAIICLAQLNRSARSDETQKSRTKTQDGEWWDTVALPTETDLRESGSIEQDADVIIFPVAAALAGLTLPEHKYRAVLKVAKQRNGPKARVRVMWDGECITYQPLLRANEGGA